MPAPGSRPLVVQAEMTALSVTASGRQAGEQRWSYASFVVPLLLFVVIVFDIPLIVTHFLQHFQRKLSKTFKGIRQEDMDRLVAYSWPGNIRELQNVLERACILARGAVVEFAEALTDVHPGSASSVPTLQEAERTAIHKALQTTGWRIGGSKGAALLLDVNPSTLRSRMTQLGIRKPPI